MSFSVSKDKILRLCACFFVNIFCCNQRTYSVLRTRCTPPHKEWLHIRQNYLCRLQKTREKHAHIRPVDSGKKSELWRTLVSIIKRNLTNVYMSPKNALFGVFFKFIYWYLQVNASFQKETNEQGVANYDPHTQANEVEHRCVEFTNRLTKKFYFYQTIYRWFAHLYLVCSQMLYF